MKNSTEFVGLRLGDRLSRLAASNHPLLVWFAALGLGFLLAQGRILGEGTSFGLAAVAACSHALTLPTAAGAMAGYLVGQGLADRVGFLAAAFLMAVGKIAVGEERWKELPVWAAPALAGAGAVVSSLAGIWASGTGYDWALMVSRLLLAAVGCYFLLSVQASARAGFRLLGRLEWIAAAVCAAMVVSGLAQLTVGPVSLGRTAAILLVLIAARVSGVQGGAVAGVAAGFAMGFVSGEFSLYITAYGLGGLLAGVFAGMGRLGAAGAFAVTNGFLVLVTYPRGELSPLLEAFAATVLFMVLPGSLLRRAEAFLLPGAGEESSSVKRVVAASLGATVAALDEISQVTQQVSGQLEKLSGPPAAPGPDQAVETVCRRCSSRLTCWQRRYDDTADGLSKAVAQLRMEGRVDPEALPEPFRERCVRLPQLLGELEKEYAAYTAGEGTRRKVSQVRSAVTDQFRGMAMFLSGLERQVEEIASGDPAATQRLREYLKARMLEPLWAVCYTDRGRRLWVKACIPLYKKARLDVEELTLELSDLLDRDLERPRVSQLEGKVVLTFSEKAELTAVFGSYQITCGGENLCGDSFRTFVTDGVTAHLILSDGMGSGGAAAVDSAMAAGLIARLAQAGVDYDSALRLVNSALLVKSGEESLATVDVTSIDLHTGRASFYKAGAAPTILRKGGRGGSVESASLPAGILKGVDFEKSTLALHPGDLVVMLSDGVCASGVDWIVSMVEHWEGEDPDQLCRQLAETARLRRNDGREYDITVLCCILQR